ncbi:MAG: hypothetical protein K9I85_09350 [Saprospiraceae bacterium]|nr:hypothetical protein [Saprospiraceae bacterium]
MTRPTPGTQMATLSETMNELRRQGIHIDLRINSAGRLKVSGHQDQYQAKDVRLAWTRRFEGQSDPDDLSILYGIQLPDGRTGVLVDGYGPASDPKVTTFIRAVQPADPEP